MAFKEVYLNHRNVMSSATCCHNIEKEAVFAVYNLQQLLAFSMAVYYGCTRTSEKLVLSCPHLEVVVEKDITYVALEPVPFV